MISVSCVWCLEKYCSVLDWGLNLLLLGVKKDFISHWIMKLCNIFLFLKQIINAHKEIAPPTPNNPAFCWNHVVSLNPFYNITDIKRMKFFLFACIFFISRVSVKTFLIQTLRKVSPPIEAGEEYSEDDKHNEGDGPSRYKETKDSMESKG